ncbi:hypothetical protein KBI33_03360 [Candidatus Shapirobacteria bacterium]|nr:hypothetical protein [Candidatus Shapirobacteria bacterium]
MRKIITGKIDPKSTIYPDFRKGANGLADVGFDKHYRINQCKDEFRGNGVHVNGDGERLPKNLKKISKIC